jgi:hypothetical protein
MLFAPIFDLAIWPMFLALGIAVLCLVFPTIIIVEAIVLRLLKWDTSWRVLLDATIMNLVSGVFGLLIPGGAALITESTAGTIVGLAAAWLVSIGIEGGILLLITKIRKQEPLPTRQAWVGSAAANTASYVLLGIVILIFTLLGDV